MTAPDRPSAAVGSWCHNDFAIQLIDEAVDCEWKHQTLPRVHAASRFSEQIAQAFHDAGVYWLPPGHTAAHADSEPLDHAASDLRLS